MNRRQNQDAEYTQCRDRTHSFFYHEPRQGHHRRVSHERVASRLPSVISRYSVLTTNLDSVPVSSVSAVQFSSLSTVIKSPSSLETCPVIQPSTMPRRGPAHFRPSPARTSAERLEQQFMRETYREFESITNKHPEAGVQFIPAIEYFDSADPDSFLAKENGYIDWSGFRTLEADEYPPGHASIQLGVSYRAWVLNSPV